MNIRLIIFIFLVTPMVAVAQGTDLITGMVVDSATFIPLGYASLQVKGTSRGTITDAKGKFSIHASRKDTLQISMLGYQSLEVPLYDWEPSAIRLAERSTLLKTIVIEGDRMQHPYEELFSDEYAKWKASKGKLPFFYSRWKKEKILLSRAREENIRVRTYVDLVVRNEDTKTSLMKKHRLSEEEYYRLLTKFNEKNHTFMYYLSAPELLSLLNTFFERETN